MPLHLLDKWQTYESTGLFLAVNGKIPRSAPSCLAWHCILPQANALLTQLDQLFYRKVPHIRHQLVHMLQHDKDPTHRATAAFLLAYLRDADEVIKLMIPSMRDPSSLVRNNAMRVLSAVIMKHEPKVFPIDWLTKTLDYPLETDRNKALAITSALTQYTQYQPLLKHNVSKQVLKLMQSVQPNLYGWAHAILQRLSGKSYTRDNLLAWEKWIRQVTDNN